MAKSGSTTVLHARVRLRACLAIGALARLGLDRPVDGEVGAVGIECDVGPAQGEDLADACAPVASIRSMMSAMSLDALGPGRCLAVHARSAVADGVEVLEGQ